MSIFLGRSVLRTTFVHLFCRLPFYDNIFIDCSLVHPSGKGIWWNNFFFPAELFAIGDFWNHFAYCHHSHCGLRPIKAWPPSVFLWSDHGCIMSLSNYIVHVEENINMLKFFCIYYYIYDSLWGSYSQICKQFLVLAIVVNEFEIFDISCIYGAQLLLSHLKKTLLNIFTLDNLDVAYSSSVHPIYIRPSLSSLAISNWATYVANCKMLWLFKVD